MRPTNTGASPENRPTQGPKSGRFAPGNKLWKRREEKAATAEEEARALKEEEETMIARTPCPTGLVARGLESIWVELVRHAHRGNVSALSRIFKLSEQYGGTPGKADSDDVDHRYDGIPDETAVLLRELDVGIADTIHRYEIGLPCADIEVLIAETAIAVREGGARSARVVELARETVPIVQKLREQKGAERSPAGAVAG
jgi:hypothetical protein